LAMQSRIMSSSEASSAITTTFSSIGQTAATLIPTVLVPTAKKWSTTTASLELVSCIVVIVDKNIGPPTATTYTPLTTMQIMPLRTTQSNFIALSGTNFGITNKQSTTAFEQQIVELTVTARMIIRVLINVMGLTAIIMKTPFKRGLRVMWRKKENKDWTNEL